MEKRKQVKNLETEIKTIVAELLKRLKLEANIDVVKEESGSAANKVDHFKVNIQTPETGLLIGHHGETLNSLQLLLGVVLYKRIGQWVHVILDVCNYRATREESLKEMVNRIVFEVEKSHQPVSLPYLNSFERRIIHLMLANHKTITSISEGSGRQRRLIIKPR